jgi:allantoinase
MDNELYSYSPLIARPAMTLPDGNRLALYVVVAIEHYLFDRPGMSIAPHAASFQPDPINYGWRDYGPRVGVWRLVDLFDRHNIPITAVVNSDACTFFPEIIAEGRKRDWAWIAHGKNNNTIHQNIGRDDERALLEEITDRIEKSAGQRPRGWIGPILTETFDTPQLLADLGYDHVLDWGGADDQPFLLDSVSPPVACLPYALELNDATLFVGRNLSGPDFEQSLIDQFEVLYREGSQSARVMCISLHPWIAGQPFRFKYLERAVAHIASHDDVWLATSNQIADWYLHESLAS